MSAVTVGRCDQNDWPSCVKEEQQCFFFFLGPIKFFFLRADLMHIACVKEGEGVFFFVTTTRVFKLFIFYHFFSSMMSQLLQVVLAN